MVAPKSASVNSSRKVCSCRSAGFSLVEVMISMFVLTLVFGGLIGVSMFTKAFAENNLYEMTAANAALSLLEQAKAVDYTNLSVPDVDADGDQIFRLVVDSSTTKSLKLGQANVLNVPLITRSDNSLQKVLLLTATPTFVPSSVLAPDLSGVSQPTGMWIEVLYSWDHPRSGKTFTDTMTGFVSLVSTY